MIRQLNEELDNLSSDRKELIKQSLQTDHLSGEVLRNSFLKSGVGIGSLITVGSTFGAPLVNGAKVTGTVLEHGKGKKVLVFKYKAKSNYRRRQGHRQPFTKVRIESIQA